MAFEWPLRVYIEDTDFGGLVYYVNHLKFMERARTECLRAAGWSQAELVSSGCLFVVASVQADYRAPARLDQQLIVRTEIKALRGARVRFAQAVVQADSDRLLSSAEVQVICVDPETMRPKRWPGELIATLREKVPQAWNEQE